jgi:omega-6 fatty acid desaturase (delta-12 desaturase)
MSKEGAASFVGGEGGFARFAKRRMLLPLAIFASNFSAYVACVLGAVLAQGIAAKIAFAIFAGVFTSTLAIIGHDAVHRSFTRSRRLNRAIGTLAFLPALHPYSRWEHHHNHVHHRYTAQLGVDNAYPPMTVQEYRRASPLRRLYYRFQRSVPGQLFFYLLDIWLPKMFLPGPSETRMFRRSDWIDIAAVYGWIAALVFGLSLVVRVEIPAPSSFATSLANAGLFGVVIPFLVWNLFISFVTIVQHTGPDVRWIAPTGRPSTPEEKLRGTVFIVFPNPIDFMFHRVMQHPAHHIYAGVPMYSLKEAQNETATRWSGISVVARWTPAYHLRLVRECKLYDPLQEGWCDFAFRPTGAPARTKLAESPH